MSETRGKSNSATLRDTMRIVGGPLQSHASRYWHGGALARRVMAFLILTHQVIRASVPLMQEAHRQSTQAFAGDPVAQGLAGYLAAHIDEERDHDAWLLEDIASAGVESDSVLANAPSANVAALVGAQYYWIRHHHPLGLYGRIPALGGLAHADGYARPDRGGGLDLFQLHGTGQPA